MTTTVDTPTPPPEPTATRPAGHGTSIFDRAILGPAILASFRKLNPKELLHNPVIFIVEIGSVYTTVLFLRDLSTSSTNENVFAGLVTFFLWATVLFANFAEAMAEGRGKAQAASLRKARTETIAHRRRRRRHRRGGRRRVCSTSATSASSSRARSIPSDGDVIEGIASVDESAITGESAPVIRESGGDRCAVTGGTRVLSDRIVVRITAKPGETFLDRMIALVEGAERQKTPNEIALSILLAGLTIIFFIAVATLQPFAMYANAEQQIIVLIALLVCLIPTTIGGLLSAIGIAGMDRLVQHNVLAMSGRAVEAAGDVSTLLLDKTGTITIGNREATELIAVHDVSEEELAARRAAVEPGRRDAGGPVGRPALRRAVRRHRHGATRRRAGAVHRADAHVGRRPRRTRAAGSGRARPTPCAQYVVEQGGVVPPELTEFVESISREGGTPLVVAENTRILGVIRLKDIVKPACASGSRSCAGSASARS